MTTPTSIRIEISDNLLGLLPKRFEIEVVQDDRGVSLMIHDDPESKDINSYGGDIVDGHGSTMEEACWALEHNADEWIHEQDNP